MQRYICSADDCCSYWHLVSGIAVQRYGEMLVFDTTASRCSTSITLTNTLLKALIVYFIAANDYGIWIIL